MIHWRLGCLLCCFFFAFPWAAQGENAIYMRVVAQNDSKAAQEEKIQVRDAVLAALPNDLSAIRQIAKEAASCETQVDIRLWAPDDSVPPAPTLYITLGEGQGRNWWGILYEDALLMARADDEPMDPEQGIVFVWPIWDWLKGLLGI